MRLLTKSDVREISANEPLPILVLSDNLVSLLGYAIRKRTRGFTHAMWLFEPGYLATQDWTYTTRPLADVLQGKHRLKFWSPAWTQMERAAIQVIIRAALSEPRRRRAYDLRGLIGQALGLRRFQASKRFYCSERVARDIRTINGGLLPEFPTPDQLDNWCEARTDWECLGIHDPTAGNSHE